VVLSGLPSTTKTGRHDIAEILLKVALKHQKSKKSKINLWILFTPLVSSNSFENIPPGTMLTIVLLLI
jgi:hypothetical protein